MPVTNYHENKSRPSYAIPMLGDRVKLQSVQKVYEQQLQLGNEAIVRGFVTRNWMLTQNICEGKTKLEISK